MMIDTPDVVDVERREWEADLIHPDAPPDPTQWRTELVRPVTG